jgi:hypothetical protein
VGLPHQPEEVGLFPSTGCVVPQSCATRGSRSYPRVLSRNQRPAVLGVSYPDTVLLLWKNNISNFTINVQEINDPRHPEDFMLVTDNNDDGCEFEHIAKRFGSNNDSDEPLKLNYAMLICVNS